MTTDIDNYKSGMAQDIENLNRVADEAEQQIRELEEKASKARALANRLQGAISHLDAEEDPTPAQRPHRKVAGTGTSGSGRRTTTRRAGGTPSQRPAREGQVRPTRLTPSWRERLRTVIGHDSLRIQDILNRLQERGWEPQSTTTNPNQYISYHLSSMKDDFERVSLGTYRVINPDRRPVSGGAAASGNVTSEGTDGDQNRIERDMAELGVGDPDVANPFPV